MKMNKNLSEFLSVYQRHYFLCACSDKKLNYLKKIQAYILNG